MAALDSYNQLAPIVSSLTGAGLLPSIEIKIHKQKVCTYERAYTILLKKKFIGPQITLQCSK